jgi:intracellular septation protein
VKIETFVFPLVLFAFLTLQILGLQKYVIEDEPEEGADEG